MLLFPNIHKSTHKLQSVEASETESYSSEGSHDDRSAKHVRFKLDSPSKSISQRELKDKQIWLELMNISNNDKINSTEWLPSTVRSKQNKDLSFNNLCISPSENQQDLYYNLQANKESSSVTRSRCDNKLKEIIGKCNKLEEKSKSIKDMITKKLKYTEQFL